MKRLLNFSSIMTDFLLWGLILAVIAGGVFWFTSKNSPVKQQTIKLAFEDANELSRGASVRMMGTEVGYVSDVQLRENHVDVIIKTNAGSLQIPSGSTFTILFTGLVGSKSIEVIPPAVTRPFIQGKPQYLVQNPIRLRQALQYQIDIAKALEDGAQNFTNFFGNKKPAEMLQYNILRSRDATLIAKNYMNRTRDTLDEKNRDAGKYLGGFVDTLDDFVGVTEEGKTVMDPKYLKPAVYSTLRYFTLLFTESQAGMVSFETSQNIQKFNHKIVGVGQGFQQSPIHQVSRPFSQLMLGLSQFERGLGLLNHSMTNVQQWLNHADVLHRVKHWDASMKKAHQGLKKINHQL
jgi:hypothetical protein